MSTNNLDLLCDPSSANSHDTPMAHTSLALADETCRLFHEQAVDHYTNEVDPPYLPIAAYPMNPASYPHLARVAKEVADRRRFRPSTSRSVTRSASANAAPYPASSPRRNRTRAHAPSSPASSPMTDLQGANGLIGTHAKASHSRFQMPGDALGLDSGRVSSDQTSVPVATRQRPHSSQPFAAGIKHPVPPSVHSDVPATNSSPNERSRATNGKAKVPASPAPRNRSLASLGARHAPVVSGMTGKRLCPKVPPGQRDTTEYKKAVANWITERIKGAPLSKSEREELLVQNFMSGKVYFRHPLNDDFDETNNLDPELWPTYTEWGKTLVPEAVIYSSLTDEEKEELFDWPDRDLWKALFMVSFSSTVRIPSDGRSGSRTSPIATHG